MKARIPLIILCWLFYGLPAAMAQGTTQAPIVPQGQGWYRVAVPHGGMVKITSQWLENHGLDPSTIDLNALACFAFPEGMLPQANSPQAAVPGLYPVPYAFTGNANNQWEANEALLAFVPRPHSVHFNAGSQRVQVTHNVYDSLAYFYLALNLPQHKLSLPQQQEALPTTAPTLNHGTGWWHYEPETFNLLQSGRQWYGPTLEASPLNITHAPEGLMPGHGAHAEAAIMSRSTQSTQINLFVNQALLASISPRKVSGSTYGFQGRAKSTYQRFTLDHGPIQVRLNRSGATSQPVYLDYLTLSYAQKLVAGQGKNSLFISASQLPAQLVLETTTLPTVWDVTYPLAPKALLPHNNHLPLGTTTQAARQLVSFDKQRVPNPLLLQAINPGPALFAPAQAPVLLIISPEAWLPEAERLAAYRRQQGTPTVVLSIANIYHSFSGGRKDPVALRNAIAAWYQGPAQGRLAHVLLFGDGSYDTQDRTPNNTAYLPTYQSRESLHNVNSYTSDDFFVMLESHEGEWPEVNTPGINDDLDLGIGRLPVRNAQEATNVVNKLMAYGQGSQPGNWQRQVLFVADDGDNNIFQQQSHFLAQLLEDQTPWLTPQRLFIGAFEKQEDNFGLRSPEVKSRISTAAQQGVLIMDYIGHGAETAWANEKVIDINQINGWTNNPRLTIGLTATCEFGRFDDPRRVSGAEYMLLNPNGAGIAMLSTSRPAIVSTNFELSLAFYTTLAKHLQQGPTTLGQLFKETKNTSIAGTQNRNFTLLGDPSMPLNVPTYKVVIDSINDAAPLQADTLKAGQKVTLKGRILQNGQTVTNSAKQLNIELWNRPDTLYTLPNSGGAPVMDYTAYTETLYQGIVNVVQGTWQASFVMPVSAPAQAQTGLLRLYTFEQGKSAWGGLDSVWLGGRSTVAIADSIAPTITAGLNRQGFISGDTLQIGILDTLKLEATLFDQNGIVLSNNPTSGLRMVWNHQADSAILLNNYYTPSPITPGLGQVSYPLLNTTEGLHSVRIAAQDPFGNTAQQAFTFYQSSTTTQGQWARAFPNPGSGTLHLQVNHKVLNQDFTIQLGLIDLNGHTVLSQNIRIAAQNNGTSLITWPALSRIQAGTYFLRVKVITKSKKQSVINLRISRI